MNFWSAVAALIQLPSKKSSVPSVGRWISDVGFLVGTSGLHFGDLKLCGYSALPALNGMTVRQFLGMVNTRLGGGSATYTISDLFSVTIDLNGSLLGGTASPYAQQHLLRP